MPVNKTAALKPVPSPDRLQKEIGVPALFMVQTMTLYTGIVKALMVNTLSR